MVKNAAGILASNLNCSSPGIKPDEERYRCGFTVWENGGSGGARTRDKSNNDGPAMGLPSQIASQRAVSASPDLARVVAAWGKLSQALKSAILAIVNTATNEEGL
jgi:hypothetical protein